MVRDSGIQEQPWPWEAELAKCAAWLDSFPPAPVILSPIERWIERLRAAAGRGPARTSVPDEE